MPAAIPAARKRTGRAQTFAVSGPEDEEAPGVMDSRPSISGVLHLPYPLVDEPKGKDHVDYPVLEQVMVSASLRLSAAMSAICAGHPLSDNYCISSGAAAAWRHFKHRMQLCLEHAGLVHAGGTWRKRQNHACQPP